MLRQLHRRRRRRELHAALFSAFLGCTPSPVVDAGAIADGGAIADDAGAIACSTGRFWTGGNTGSPLMKPGSRCLDCHDFLVAGTVHGARDDVADCDGVAGAVVRLTGSDGAVLEATTNAAGNFFIESGTLRIPYTASVLYEGRAAVMENDQTNYECAACHTARGLPGRIVAP